MDGNNNSQRGRNAFTTVELGKQWKDVTKNSKNTGTNSKTCYNLSIVISCN